MKALLPNSGTDIKGHMRSEAELLALLGLRRPSPRLRERLHILDSEVRLITPTDPEGTVMKSEGPQQEDQSGTFGSRENEPDLEVHPCVRAEYYQLTHDYLVPSLRDWLNRKLRETRRGRAELRLADRTAFWSGQPENRFLPPWWEWLALRLLTRQRDWTTPQRTMMRRAARHYAAWGLLVCRRGRCCLLLVGARGLWPAAGPGYCRIACSRPPPKTCPTLCAKWALIGAGSTGRSARPTPTHATRHDARRQLHASLGLLPVDPGQAGYLRDRLLTAPPQEVLVIRDALQPHAAEVSPWLWEVARGREEAAWRAPAGGVRTGRVMHRTTRGGDRVSRDVAARLAAENGLVIARWAEALRPVREHLLPPLAALLVEDGQDAAGRRTITGLYGDYARGLPNAFVPLEEQAAAQTDPTADLDDRLANQASPGQRGRGPGRAWGAGKTPTDCFVTRPTRRSAAT